MFDRYYTYFLFGLFLFFWVWSMWYPASALNWFLENKAVFVSIPIIYFLLIRYIRFSKLSLTLITVFVILHVIGSHYNYGSVPIGKALGAFFRTDENIYDKFVHFSFGLLVAYPLREFFLRVADVKGFWGYLVPFMGILTLGVLYEIFEWATVLQYSPAVGYLFIGGNDPFDTTKDLFASTTGAALTLGFLFMLAYARSKNQFRDEMKGSFKRDKRTFPKEDAHLHEKIEGAN